MSVTYRLPYILGTKRLLPVIASPMSADTSLTVEDPDRYVPAHTMPFTAEATLSAARQVIYQLNLPVVKQAVIDKFFFNRFPIKTGVTMLINGSNVELLQYADQTQLREADYSYLGGYIHEVDQHVARIIQEAGYGYLLEELNPYEQV